MGEVISKGHTLFKAWKALQYKLLLDESFQYERARGSWATFIPVTLLATDGFGLPPYEEISFIESRGRTERLASRYFSQRLWKEAIERLVENPSFTRPSTARFQSFIFYFENKSHLAHFKHKQESNEKPVKGGNCLAGFSVAFGKEFIYLDVWQRASEVTKMLVGDIRFLEWCYEKMVKDAGIITGERPLRIRWNITVAHYNDANPPVFFLWDMGPEAFYRLLAKKKIDITAKPQTYRPWLNYLRYTVFNRLFTPKIDQYIVLRRTKRKINAVSDLDAWRRAWNRGLKELPKGIKPVEPPKVKVGEIDETTDETD